MTAVGEVAVLAGVIAVVLGGLVAGLVTAGVRRARLRGGGGADGTIAPPREGAATPAPPTGEEPPPGVPEEAAAERPGATAAPTIERPEGMAGRLVRLRQRL